MDTPTTILTEVVGSILAPFVLFSEPTHRLYLLGGLVLMVGIWLWRRRASSARISAGGELGLVDGEEAEYSGVMTLYYLPFRKTCGRLGGRSG